MLALSLGLHICLFLIVLFLPESLPSGRIKGVVYEVDLVEAPSSGPVGQPARPAVEKKGDTGILKESNPQARRILVPKSEKKPLVVAKRTVKRESTKIKKPEVSPTKLIDEAISRIEKKVESEKNDNHVEEAISELEKKAKAGDYGVGAGGGGRSLEGLPMRIYQVDVENRIKSNWSYPVAIHDQKKLEAIVMLKVSQDGAISKSWFKKRSTDAIFDESVMRAVERSNPLPPFPEGYRKSYEEFEINFNLKDLEGS